MKIFIPLLLGFAVAAAQAEEILIDAVVAIVDDSVITQRDLENRIELIAADFRQAQRRLPDRATLRRQVLEVLVTDSRGKTT